MNRIVYCLLIALVPLVASQPGGNDTGATLLNPTCVTNFGTPQAMLGFNALQCTNLISSSSCANLVGGAKSAATSISRDSGCDNVTATLLNDIVTTCPAFCGYCCLTTAFNCSNAALPTLNCATITQSMCNDPAWRQEIAQNCPATCGFCEMGGCVDAATNCASQITICSNPNMASFVQQNCQRTCGLCANSTLSSSTTPYGSYGGGSVCAQDNNSACAVWAQNGFCKSYPTSTQQQYCPHSCGLPCNG